MLQPGEGSLLSGPNWCSSWSQSLSSGRFKTLSKSGKSCFMRWSERNGFKFVEFLKGDHGRGLVGCILDPAHPSASACGTLSLAHFTPLLPFNPRHAKPLFKAFRTVPWPGTFFSYSLPNSSLFFLMQALSSCSHHMYTLFYTLGSTCHNMWAPWFREGGHFSLPRQHTGWSRGRHQWRGNEWTSTCPEWKPNTLQRMKRTKHDGSRVQTRPSIHYRFAWKLDERIPITSSPYYVSVLLFTKHRKSNVVF